MPQGKEEQGDEKGFEGAHGRHSSVAVGKRKALLACCVAGLCGVCELEKLGLAGEYGSLGFGLYLLVTELCIRIYSYCTKGCIQ